jgi:hypothetical protein
LSRHVYNLRVQPHEVVVEIQRQIAWLQARGAAPAAVALGRREYDALERAIEAPSCEAPLSYVEPDQLRILGLPVRRANSPSDIHVTADSALAE